MWKRNGRLVSGKWASRNRRLISERQKGIWALRKEKVREKRHFMTIWSNRFELRNMENWMDSAIFGRESERICDWRWCSNDFEWTMEPFGKLRSWSGRLKVLGQDHYFVSYFPFRMREEFPILGLFVAFLYVRNFRSEH